MVDDKNEKVDGALIPSNPRLKDAFSAIDYLLSKFRFERAIYLIIVIISVVFLFWFATNEMVSGDLNIDDLGPLLGSSGLVGATSYGVLRIFNQAHQIVVDALKGDGE